MAQRAGPLAALRVLEFGQIAAGPFTGSLLADLGADILTCTPSYAVRLGEAIAEAGVELLRERFDVDVNGATLGNSDEGIRISGGAAANTIGGSGAGNTIAFNGGRGVSVSAGINPIRGNAIFANGNIGIDLLNNGVTANDAGDADLGPNGLQNFPVLTAATNSGVTTVDGTLNSMAATTFTLEFFANPTYFFDIGVGDHVLRLQI